jgi:hypothetical protein
VCIQDFFVGVTLAFDEFVCLPNWITAEKRVYNDIVALSEVNDGAMVGKSEQRDMHMTRIKSYKSVTYMLSVTVMRVIHYLLEDSASYWYPLLCECLLSTGQKFSCSCSYTNNSYLAYEICLARPRHATDTLVLVPSPLPRLFGNRTRDMFTLDSPSLL